MNLFGLASGIVLTGNLGRWASELTPRNADRLRPRRGLVLAGLIARGLVAALAGYMIFAVVTGRFDRATGAPRRFGLREAPLAYAHNAAHFAGQPGLPDKALAYDLVQAGVYLFHNGPRRKVFMDGRLEVPENDTFATYVRLENMLNEGRHGWAEPLRRMGDPLVLLGHTKEFGAEATLLVDPGWRCIYFDEVASIFVARGRIDPDQAFPAVDFAARHFRDRQWQACRRARRASPLAGHCSPWPPRWNFGMGSPEPYPFRSTWPPRIDSARRLPSIAQPRNTGRFWDSLAGT